MWVLLPWICVLVLTFFLVDWYRRQPRITDLNRRFILVTGCDTGFGKMLVQRLDALGCHVFAGCLTESGQVELRAVCTQRVKTVCIDVTDADSVRRAFDFVANIVPVSVGLWGLVNNAAIPGVSAGPIEWLAADDFRRVLEVNTVGLIDVTLTFLPLLKRSKGRIVNMSSTGGRLPGPLALPHDVSKSAVEAFSDGLRRHLCLYECGVSVHTVEPSIFKTAMVDPERHKRMFDVTWRRLPTKVKEEFGHSFYSEYVRRTLGHHEPHRIDRVPQGDRRLRARAHLVVSAHALHGRIQSHVVFHTAELPAVCAGGLGDRQGAPQDQEGSSRADMDAERCQIRHLPACGQQKRTL